MELLTGPRVRKPLVIHFDNCDQPFGLLCESYTFENEIPFEIAQDRIFNIQNNDDDIKPGWTIISINGKYLDPNEMEDYVSSCLQNKQSMKFEFQVNFTFFTSSDQYPTHNQNIYLFRLNLYKNESNIYIDVR